MAVYPVNMAPISVKLCENAFQTFPDISFFDAEKKIGGHFRSAKIVWGIVHQDFLDLAANGPHHQLPRQILL